MFDAGALNGRIIAVIAIVAVVSYIYNRIAYPRV